MAKEKPFDKNLTEFLRHIDSINDTLPLTIALFKPFARKANNEFRDFIENKVDKTKSPKGEDAFIVNLADAKLFEALESNAVISSLAEKIIPSSLFVSLISQYDAFLNRLLRILYKLKPEILNGSDRNLTFSQLVDLGSISDARELIIEKEIDATMRKSHAEQIEYIEGKLGMKLRVNLPIWSEFIEITERRNLLVHCDGIVSHQYLNVCSDHSCSITNVKVGQQLKVDLEYFNKAYSCLYELGTKLTHTLWRKFIPEDSMECDDDLNGICYDLIVSGSYGLADTLLKFACDQRKHHDDQSKSIFIINAALSKYLQGNKTDTEKILKLKDWSSTGHMFKLAYNILSGENEAAYEIIKKIGVDGEVKKSQYQQWPLFKLIRFEEKFKDLYKELFNEDYKIIEIPLRPVAEAISKAKNGSKAKSLTSTSAIPDSDPKLETETVLQAETPTKAKFRKKPAKKIKTEGTA